MSQNVTPQNKKPRRAKSFNGTNAKESLLKAATHLFAVKGLKGTSIREISKLAKVNTSMISYYFGSKEQLYRECVLQIGQTRLDVVKQILTSAKNKSEYKIKLRMFAETLLDLFINEREAGLIIMREFDRAHSPAGQAFKENFLNIFDLLLMFLKKSQKDNLIKTNQKPFFLTTVFFGTLVHHMRMDHIVEKKYNKSLKNPKHRKELEDQLIDLFL